jgi:hypothetical protein
MIPNPKKATRILAPVIKEHAFSAISAAFLGVLRDQKLLIAEAAEFAEKNLTKGLELTAALRSSNRQRIVLEYSQLSRPNVANVLEVISSGPSPAKAVVPEASLRPGADVKANAYESRSPQTRARLWHSGAALGGDSAHRTSLQT